MRKNYKKKSESLCGMCKDYKRGGASRWTDRERDAQKRFERTKQQGEEQ